MKKWLLTFFMLCGLWTAEAQVYPPITTGYLRARGRSLHDSGIVVGTTFRWDVAGSFRIHRDTLVAISSDGDSLKILIDGPAVNEVLASDANGVYRPASLGALGGGTVTSLSSGNLDSLFTTSVSTATTTPTLSFSKLAVPAHLWYGNPGASTAEPNFRNITRGDILFDMFKYRKGSSAYRTDSVTIIDSGVVRVSLSNDTLKIAMDDSLRKSLVTDSLHNIRQEVWQRTAAGEASLVNLADSLLVGRRSMNGNTIMRGKLSIWGNSAQPTVIMNSDSGLNDQVHFRGRMNTNGYWQIYNRSADNSLIFSTGQNNSANNYTTFHLGGAGQGKIGIQMAPVNTLDIGGNASVNIGTAPSMGGSGNFYVHNNFSAGFANTAVVGTNENIMLGVDADADGLYIGSTYSAANSGGIARKVWREVGLTTTTNATPTAKAIFSMNSTNDSTTCVQIEVDVVAYRSGGGTPANRGQASYKLIGTFGYENGAVIQLGTTSIPHFGESDAALDCTLSASGNNVILTFTGIASETWRWQAYEWRAYAGHTNQ